MIYYCRRCDLGFCDKHINDHPPLEGHMLAEDERVEFCSVCTGIYRPPLRTEQV